MYKYLATTRFVASSLCRIRKLSVASVSVMSTSAAGSEEQRLVEVDTIGHVCLIALNRPEKRNCVNQATAQQLFQAFDTFESSPDLYVAVLYGKGGNFCAGYDLGEVASNPEMPVLMEAKDLENGRGPMGPSRKMFSKPVIAAVSGYAVAGGLELAAMCDLRVLDETAVMGVFCRRFGVPLLDGGTVRLPQLIGLSRALDVILTGRPIAAKEALEMGLANRVVPTGTAVGEATKLAQTLCNFPQECMRRDRISAFNSCFEARSLAEAFDFEWNNAKHVVNTESIAGARKFVDGVGRSGSFNINSSNKSKL